MRAVAAYREGLYVGGAERGGDVDYWVDKKVL